MNKIKAIVLGIFTILPVAYIVFFVSFVMRTFIGIKNSNVDNTMNLFKIIFPMHFSTMILMVILMIVYIKDVFNNESIDSDKRTLWAIVLFFGNIIAMPIYWYAKIWKPISKQ